MNIYGAVLVDDLALGAPAFATRAASAALACGASPAAQRPTARLLGRGFTVAQYGHPARRDRNVRVKMVWVHFPLRLNR
jgi:hypothetical protein